MRRNEDDWSGEKRAQDERRGNLKKKRRIFKLETMSIVIRDQQLGNISGNKKEEQAPWEKCRKENRN